MADTLTIPFQNLNQVPFVFPLKGKSQGWSRDAQPEGTTPDCLNVLPFDLTSRMRGGARAGFAKANAGALGTSAPYIQAISEVDSINFVTTLRQTFFAAFTQGTVYSGPNPATLTAADNLAMTNPAATGIYQTTQAQARLIFLDGVTVWQMIPSYDSSAGGYHAVYDYIGAAHGGTSPAAYGYQCCCTYRGRLVLANQGPTGNPQTWIMSRVLDTADWDVSKKDPAAAVSGSSSTAGQVGEAITALIPYGDDLMLFGADHSLWLLSGDPAYGGIITPINRGVGVFGPNSWALDPDRNLYFVGTGGFYRLQRAGYQIQSLSNQVLDDYFNALVRGTHLVRCEWDREKHGCWIFVTAKPANAVFALPFTNSAGSGAFTVTLNSITTAGITFSGTAATLVTNLNSAFNSAYGAGAIVASGATLAAIQLTYTGPTYGERAWPVPTAHITSGSGFTVGPATVVTAGGPTASTHLWWDGTSQGFFPQQLPTAMGPTASCTYDDGTANDRGLVIGGFNGFTYTPAPTSGSDDGTAINSFVWLGPVKPYGGGQRGKHVALDVILGETPAGFAGANCFAVATLNFADDAYTALTAPIVTATHTFTAVGRNTIWRVRGRGTHAMLKWAQTTLGKTMTLESAVGQWLAGGRVRA